MPLLSFMRHVLNLVATGSYDDFLKSLAAYARSHENCFFLPLPVSVIITIPTSLGDFSCFKHDEKGPFFRGFIPLFGNHNLLSLNNRGSKCRRGELLMVSNPSAVKKNAEHYRNVLMELLPLLNPQQLGRSIDEIVAKYFLHIFFRIPFDNVSHDVSQKMALLTREGTKAHLNPNLISRVLDWVFGRQAYRGHLLREAVSGFLTMNKLPVDTDLSHIYAALGALPPFLMALLYRVATHPDIQQDILRELVSHHPDTQLNGLQDIRLDFLLNVGTLLDNVVTEVCRLHPPVPVSFRQDEVSSRHAVILLAFSGGVGDDFLCFRPQRYGEYTKARDFVRASTFMTGERACPGQHLAFMIAKFFLSHLIVKYSFKCDGDIKTTLNDGVNRLLKEPRIKFDARENAGG